MSATLQLFVATLTAFILWRIYDGLRALPQTTNVSMAWHTVSFIFMFLLSGYVYYTLYGISWQGFKPALALTAVCWCLADVIFNKINRRHWLYAGDGKNSFLERQFSKISVCLKQPLWLIFLLAKIIYIAMIISIILIF